MDSLDSFEAQFSLRKTPFFDDDFRKRLGLTILFAFIAASLLWGTASYYREHLVLSDYLQIVLLGASVPIFFTISRWLGRGFGPASPLRFERKYCELPVSAGSSRVFRIRYEDFELIDLAGRGADARLWLGSNVRMVRYRRDDFIDENSLEKVVSHLNAKLLKSQDHVALAAGMLARKKASELLAQKSVYLVPALQGAWLLAWAMPLFMPGSSDSLEAIRLGANNGHLVGKGEFERLMASTFLHGGVVHLLFNWISMSFLGGILERVLGLSRVIIVYGLSGLAAALASAYFHPHVMSLGASGAIFGCLGLFLYVGLKYAPWLPLGFRLPNSTWWNLILINSALAGLMFFLNVQIDHIAHGVGFAVGLMLGPLLVEPASDIDDVGAAPLGQRAMAAVLVLLFVSSFYIATRHAFDPAARDDLDFLVEMLAQDELPSGLRNNYAYSLVISKQARPDDIDVAFAQIPKLLKEELLSAAVLDTVSTIYDRKKMKPEATVFAMRALRDARLGTPSEFVPIKIARYQERDGYVKRVAQLLDSQSGGRIIDIDVTEDEGLEIKPSIEGYILVQDEGGRSVALGYGRAGEVLKLSGSRRPPIKGKLHGTEFGPQSGWPTPDSGFLSWVQPASLGLMGREDADMVQSSPTPHRSPLPKGAL